MPLFESQKGRNDRLFVKPTETFARNLLLWLDAESGKMGPEEYADYRVLYPAWCLGGSVAAGVAVLQSERIAEAWGNGDEDKALALTELFTTAMVSVWYGTPAISEGRSESERAAAFRAAASNVLAFFEDDSPEYLEAFASLDLQMNHDATLRQGRDSVARLEDLPAAGTRVPVSDFLEANGMPMADWTLLCAMAEQACGGAELDLSRVRFPVRNARVLRERLGTTPLSVKDLVGLPVAVTGGVAAMFEHYSHWSQRNA